MFLKCYVTECKKWAPSRTHAIGPTSGPTGSCKFSHRADYHKIQTGLIVPGQMCYRRAFLPDTNINRNRCMSAGGICMKLARHMCSMSSAVEWTAHSISVPLTFTFCLSYPSSCPCLSYPSSPSHWHPSWCQTAPTQLPQGYQRVGSGLPRRAH